ncbi:nitronate monooxygenase [bacterium]|nr:nitronate monooxygenase [bacterium]
MKTLDDLWKAGKNFLNVDIPVMCGAMTWISESRLVAHVSNAGAFGCLAGGNMDPELLLQEIDDTKQLTNKPFAVNLITIAPNYKKQLDLINATKVPYIIFAGGIPKADEIQKAKLSGAKVLCFASTESIAKRMIDRGADALMLEGSEAGGHIGHVSLIILLQQILFEFPDFPIFVAGGIGTGRIIPHLLLMGAFGVQLGTLFVLSEECNVNPKFKQAFIRARARDAVATPQIGSELHVVAVRALRNKGMDQFADLQMRLIQSRKHGQISQEEAQFEVERYWVGALRRAAIEGDTETGSLMAGQSVGLAKEIKPIKNLLSDLIADAEKELKRIQEKLI